MALVNNIGYDQMQQASYQRQIAEKMALSGNLPQQEFSVQDRLSTTLGTINQCMGVLDSLEDSVQPEQAAGGPPLGLIGASLACTETADRLLKRLIALRERLGTL